MKLEALLAYINERGITKIDESWAMRCFFHEEKTPSMVVNRTAYHCFSCNKSGSLSDLDIDLEKECQNESN